MKGSTELCLTSGYSDEAAFQQYLQRVLATTLNKGLHMQDDTGRSSQPPAALLPLCPQGKQDHGFPIAPHEKSVYPRATDHVFQPMPQLLFQDRWDMKSASVGLLTRYLVDFRRTPDSKTSL